MVIESSQGKETYFGFAPIPLYSDSIESKGDSESLCLFPAPETYDYIELEHGDLQKISINEKGESPPLFTLGLILRPLCVIGSCMVSWCDDHLQGYLRTSITSLKVSCITDSGHLSPEGSTYCLDGA